MARKSLLTLGRTIQHIWWTISEDNIHNVEFVVNLIVSYKDI